MLVCSFEERCHACGAPAPEDDREPRLCCDCMSALLREDNSLATELTPEALTRLLEVAEGVKRG